MIGETFEILIAPFYDTKKYRMRVEITYQSDQVLRFTISAGEKSIEMEKLIYRKTNQWKVKRINLTSHQNTQKQAEAILKIQDEIDYYLKRNKIS